MTINYETGEIVEFDRGAAERRAERITLRLDAIADNYRAVLPMIREAIEKRDDLALGYRSPGDYVSDRFGQSLAGLGIEARRAVVGELTQAGLSTRAIAPVVGVSKSTVDRDIDQVSHVGHLQRDESPEPEPSDDVVDADLIDDEPEAHDDEPAPEPAPPVVGRDGKTYTRPEPKAPARHRKPYLEDLARAVSDLSRANEKVVNLMGDDRLPRNAEEAAAQNRSDLCRIRDAVQGVIDRLA